MTSSARTHGRPARAPAPRVPLVLVCLAALVVATGCRQDMHDAPRYDPLEASSVFPGGGSARPLVEGTVARGQLGDDELLVTGKLGGAVASVFPFAMTAADLDRGEERFNIFCSPCHGRTGEGNGMVVQRGFRQPPSFHSDRLRQVPAGYLFDVMTSGFGTMSDYRAQVTPEDRWRIAAYLRALQLTRQGTAADVSAENLARLRAGDVAPAPAAAGGDARGEEP